MMNEQEIMLQSARFWERFRREMEANRYPDWMYERRAPERTRESDERATRMIIRDLFL